MKRELFHPYRDFLLRIIKSVETPEQQQVCYDMIERFLERFRGILSIPEYNQAEMDLMEAYQGKADLITII